MRMYFDADKAWNHLVASGQIHTLRGLAKRFSWRCEVSIFRHGRPTGRRALRLFLREVTGPEDLFDSEVGDSGFRCAEEWWAKAKELSGDGPKRLFRVVLLPQEGRA